MMDKNCHIFPNSQQNLKVMAYNICKICLQHIFIQITMATKKIAIKEVATIVR